MVIKPSSNEEEYFKKHEIKKMKVLEQERAAKMEEEEKSRLKELHYMKCPKCGMDLIEVKHESVSLDRCVSCGGTWFDDGEIEQLLDEKSDGVLSKVMSIFK